MADALTRASLPRQASDGPQTRIKVEAVEGSDLVAQAITVLAPHVLTLPSKARQAAQGAIKAEMNNLPPDRLAELRRFLAKGSLNRDTLALLSLKARAGVLKIHYVTCKPWSSLALEDRKPEKLRTWLEQNLPDYRALELVLSDLGSVDKDAYRKVRNWKSEGVIASTAEFGLVEGARPLPSQHAFEEERRLVAESSDEIEEFRGLPDAYGTADPRNRLIPETLVSKFFF